MTIKDRQSGMIMRSENPLVVEQWKKQGFTEYVKPLPEAEAEAEAEAQPQAEPLPEAKPRQRRKKQ